MLGGDICTRSCKFCNVTTGRPAPLDPAEPDNIAQSVKLLRLKHAVLTSVDRDDLPDLGASHWAKVVGAVRSANPLVTMETLIPDFQGRKELIDMVINASPEIISHNMETVRRLSKAVRSRATYELSLTVIEHIAASGRAVAKSGIMVGLGETHDEVLETMRDLRNAGCSVLTVGQYLRPSKANIEVAEYIHPDVFEQYRVAGLEMGFRFVESAPLVRSSFHAEKHLF
jgi:lipoic acid synthetase